MKEKMKNLELIRKEYSALPLFKDSLLKDPLSQFQLWLDQALQAQILEPNAMTLATSTKEGKPSTRIVLLKKCDAEGLVFFTNFQSRKAHELTENPFASLCFFWKELERQVIIEGKVERISNEDNQAYFALRPRGSQLGAWASQQGRELASREELEKEFAHVEKLYEGKEVPLPPFWGGFRLQPTQYEFWQGRPNRLHDRFRYTYANGHWRLVLLAP